MLATSTTSTKIVERSVMMTPALVVDGKVRLAGKIPKKAELKSILTDAN